MVTKVSGTSQRWRRSHGVSLVCAALAAIVCGCFDAGGVTLSTLNQRDDAVVLEVFAEKTNAFVLPPHSYTGLYSTRSQLSPDWHVRVLDEQCHLIVDQPMAISSGILYMAADGTVSWQRGTNGATGYSEVVTPSPTACPG